jgi:carboxypeptidase C (cathepsin A)
MYRTSTSALVTFALAGLAAAAFEADRVTSLPEMGTFDKFGVFSGYLPIEDTEKKLHYMFVEAAENAADAPLIIWFNGGPGCSSMLGWAQEHGPFVMESGGSEFHENEYSWNRGANMLYIESPAGVGFSYCQGEKDCSFNDETSSLDNLAAVLAWF